MENSFLNQIKNDNNYMETENGALAHKSTKRKVYDLFALGGAYRKRSLSDCILLFKEAFEEDQTLALKCLFYLRDVRGGQGERRFFRAAFKWLCDAWPEYAQRNLIHVSEYGRWDDLLYATDGTILENYALQIIEEQLKLDCECKTPSLLGKWMPSENASAYDTKRLARKVRKHLGWTSKQYRKTLSDLREKINVVERLMSANEWDKIEFDKIPSRAGLIYKNAFARRDIIAKKYETFAKSKETTVNAKALYPYEVVEKALREYYSGIEDTGRLMVNKYWENLPDYLQGKDCKMMCVVDTSASMHGTPINVAISLGLYCAERIGEPFKNTYIAFSANPRFVETRGIDFVDKVKRIYDTNLCENTNLEKVFKLLKETALKPNVRPEDLPETIVVISDMQIDRGTDAGWGGYYEDFKQWRTDNAETEMEKIRKEWAAVGLKLPNLVYWNVDAREDTILDSGDSVTFVSGCSPVIFESVLRGVKGWDLCLEKLMSERYKAIV